MFLSKESLEILIDLVEIRLDTLQIIDKEDAKELSRLQLCRSELLQTQSQLEELHGVKKPLSISAHKKQKECR